MLSIHPKVRQQWWMLIAMVRLQQEASIEIADELRDGD
jgi:hypothetical protein